MKTKLQLKKQTIEMLGDQNHYGGTKLDPLISLDLRCTGASCDPCCYPGSALDPYSCYKPCGSADTQCAFVSNNCAHVWTDAEGNCKALKGSEEICLEPKG